MFSGAVLKLSNIGTPCTGKKAAVLYTSRDSYRLFYFVCCTYSVVAVPVLYTRSLPSSHRLSCRDREDDTCRYYTSFLLEVKIPKHPY